MPMPPGDPNQTLNARNLSFKAVAETFVVNEHFGRLRSNSHTLLVGTRGSGKTTLFKMLTYRALSKWNDEHAHETLRGLPFWAVYIPTDSQWERELKALPTVEGSHSLLWAAITTNVFHGFTEALQDALDRDFPGMDSANGRDPQQELARAAVKHWMLPPTTLADLDGVLLALSDRVSEIAACARRLREARGGPRPDMPPYVHLDFLAALLPVCETLRIMFPAVQQRKWALCFDELEILPRALEQELLDKRRGSAIPAQALHESHAEVARGEESI